MDENIENMSGSLDSLSRLEDKGQNLNYKQLQAPRRGDENELYLPKFAKVFAR